MTLRVAVWGTGGVGSHAVRAIARRPDLELVGVWVHSPEKNGVDAGTLVGIEPLGIIATNEADEILALDLDCIVYTASGPLLDAGALPDYERFLNEGINVVTVTSPALVFPPSYPQRQRDRLDAAALGGDSTLYASGIEPGFAADQFPLALLTLSSSIRSVRVQELFTYDTYPVEFTMREVFGFGKPMDHAPIMASTGAQLMTWGPVVQLVAAGLGVELDEIRETWTQEPTPRDLDTAFGPVAAGTVGAVRFETIGVVNGREAIIVEHINRLKMDLVPEWPSAPRDGTYRVIIEGEPDLECELLIGSATNYYESGMLATAMRIVNAVPHVVDAAPGLVSSLDLPLTTPRHAFD
ncbi:MAG: dihydrodipicolinate reductase [Actinomycetes bacterium]